MKIVFAGTPDFASTVLDALIQAGHEIALVLSQPDRPAGRGMKPQASAVKQFAQAHHLPVYQPEKLKTPESWQPIQAAGADVMVVVAYGLILPQAVLDIPRLACLNVHASLLPRWRGAAPIHRAIEAGDAQTGVCIMQMEAGLDTGPVLKEVVLDIDPRETTGSLHDKLAKAGAKALCDVLAQPFPAPKRQADVGVTYAHKISKSEAAIDWSRSSIELDRQIRAFNPFPAATCVGPSGLLKVWAAEPVRVNESGKPGEVLAVGADGLVIACGQGALALHEVQPQGSRRMSISDFLAGHRLTVGTVFETPRQS